MERSLVMRGDYMSWLVMSDVFWCSVYNRDFLVRDMASFMVNRGRNNRDWMSDSLMMILLGKQLLIKFLRHLHILANFLSNWLTVFWLSLLDSLMMDWLSWHFHISNLSRLSLSISDLGRVLPRHLDVSSLRLTDGRIMWDWLWLHIVRLLDDVAWCHLWLRPRDKATIVNIAWLHQRLWWHVGWCAKVSLLRNLMRAILSPGQVVPIVHLFLLCRRFSRDDCGNNERKSSHTSLM